MTCYIELIFLENIIINYIIINQISIITKCHKKTFREIIGIIVLGLYSTLNYVFYKEIIANSLIKILIINFSIYIIYNPKSISLYIKLILFYFLNSFLLVGIIISISLILNITLDNILIKMLMYFLGGVILLVFNKLMWKLWKSKIKSEDYVYMIKIRDMLIPGFVDTGNNVFDYEHNRDVIFLEEKYKKNMEEKNLLKKRVKINISTINDSDERCAYIINDVDVIKNNVKVHTFKNLEIIFVKRKLNENYNALISYDTYIEKLKGVKLC